MPDQTTQDSPLRNARHIRVPSIEDGGVDDNTVASPALGYGMKRVDRMDEIPDPELLQTQAQTQLMSAQPQAPSEPASPQPQAQTQPQAQYQPQPMPPQSFPHEDGVIETLGKHEVAAVNVDRPYYVSDAPSPYLSSRQAREDVRDTKKRHSRITTVLVVLLIAIVVGGSGWFLWNSMHSPVQELTTRYETETITKGEYTETIDTTSLIKPIDESVVTSGVSGSVEEVFVENGASVEEGELIFRLDNPTIRDATNRAAEAVDTFSKEVTAKAEALDKANEAVAKAQEAVDKEAEKRSNQNSNSNSNSNNSSSSSSSSTSSSTSETSNTRTAAELALEDAKKKATAAQNELDAANTNLANIQQTYERALEQQETLNVYAPITGNVSDLNDQAKPEGKVTGSTRLCIISNTSSYKVIIQIPEDQRDQVGIGEEVRLTFPSIEDLAVTSEISNLDEDENEVLFATVLIHDPDERITKGIAAEASVILKSIPNTHIVPSAAVRTSEDGGNYLEVLLDPSRGIVTNIPVKVLANDGTKAAVEADNIQADTSVVISSSPIDQTENASSLS